MMPKRVAETDPYTQISEFTGSGPFIFKRDAVEARRQDRLRQERQVQAALRAGLAAGRRQGALRSTASNGSPCTTTSRRSTRCSPARSTSSRRRRSICTPPHGRPEHPASDLEPRRQPEHLSPQPPAQAVRQSDGAPRALVRLQPGGFPEGRDRRPDPVQGTARRCSSAARLASDKGMAGCSSRISTRAGRS